MLNSLKNLFRAQPERPAPAAIPAGERVYAIGDIHGRLDLFEALVGAIEADEAERGPARTTLILLGDLIDRGPDSAGVIRAARALRERRALRILGGNHEEMLLLALHKDEVLRAFLRHGGRETVLSYPIAPEAVATADWEQLRDLMATAIPADDLDFIRTFEDTIRIGDYLFVHAGIMPGMSLEEQRPADLRWIREPFLGHAGDHGYVVVHGHTITEDVELRANRIGIDTGAFFSGRLTALGLEAGTRWVIQTRVDIDTVTTHTRSVA